MDSVRCSNLLAILFAACKASAPLPESTPDSACAELRHPPHLYVLGVAADGRGIVLEQPILGAIELWNTRRYVDLRFGGIRYDLHLDGANDEDFRSESKFLPSPIVFVALGSNSCNEHSCEAVAKQVIYRCEVLRSVYYVPRATPESELPRVVESLIGAAIGEVGS